MEASKEVFALVFRGLKKKMGLSTLREKYGPETLLRTEPPSFFPLSSSYAKQIKSTMRHDCVVMALVPFMLSLSSQEEVARGRKRSRDHGNARGLMAAIAPTTADGSSEVIARTDSGSIPRT